MRTALHRVRAEAEILPVIGKIEAVDRPERSEGDAPMK